MLVSNFFIQRYIYIVITDLLLLLVYEKLKREGAADDFKADLMEEYEDEEGNVFNKKTYEDLRRQGIL